MKKQSSMYSVSSIADAECSHPLVSNSINASSIVKEEGEEAEKDERKV